MSRPTWDELFIKIAEEVSERSSCSRIKVGAVLAQDNRIVSIGYNGSIPDGEHCDTHFYEYWRENYKEIELPYVEWIENSTDFFDLHYEWASIHEIHAEQNAILYAAKKGIPVEGSTLYVTYSPCKHCAKAISQSGIKKIIYKRLYYRSTKGLELLEQAGIPCEKLS